MFSMAKAENNSTISKGKIIALVILIVVLAVVLPRLSGGSMKTMKEKTIPNAVKLAINNPTTKFTIGEVKEKSNVYEFKLKIGEGAAGQEYTSYITKDGKLLFTSAIDVEKLSKPQATPTPVKKVTCSDLPKTSTAKLTAYVVSNCPFGLQMQRLINKTISEQPELAKNIEVKYIGAVENGKITSMHGDAEAVENLKQICLREEQSNLYWPYVSCYMAKEGQGEACLSTAGVDQASLTACTADATRGLKYAQADFTAANKVGATGSPTLTINGKTVSEFDFGGRVADAMKQIVCCGSSTQAAFCKNSLSKDEIASSFSETDASGTTTSSAANCATQ